MVSKKGTAQVAVSAGTAIDSAGRQLVLADPEAVELPASLKTKPVCLYVLYKEDPVDLQKQAGSEDNRRWLEKPDLKAVAKGEELKFDYPAVLLAELALDVNGAITGDINNQVREYSGLRLPGPGTDTPALRTGAGGLVNLQGGLTVTGNVGIATNDPKGNALRVGTGSVRFELGAGQKLSLGGSGSFEVDAPNVVGGRLIVTTDGKVGMGTENPGAKLEVGGTLTASTDNEALVALKIAPTFQDSGKSGVKHYGLIVADGNVGVSATNPGVNLDVGGKGDTSGQVSLQLRSGNSSATYASNQITLGYANTAEYRHAIKTRQNSKARSGNAIDFYVWKYLSASDKDGADIIGTLHTMTLDGGNVGSARPRRGRSWRLPWPPPMPTPSPSWSGGARRTT